MITPSELGRMFDAASADEAVTLTEVAERAGLLWRCPDPYCGLSNDEEDARCVSCGRPKPGNVPGMNRRKGDAR